MPTLYEITAEFEQLFELAEEEDVTMDVLNDTFESIGAEFEDKAQSYAVVLRSLQAETAGLKEEVSRLNARIKRLDSNAENIKKTLERAMIATGKRKFSTKLFGFSIQKNAPSLDMVNEDLLDEKYFVQHDPTVDRAALLKDVKADPDAFAGIATIKQTESIRIR